MNGNIALSKNIGLLVETLNASHHGLQTYTFNLISHFPNLPTISLINNKPADTGFPFQTILLKSKFPIFKTYSFVIRAGIAKINIDIVHNLSGRPMIAKRKGRKIVTTVHDLTFYKVPESHPFIRRTLYTLLYPRTLQISDKIITDSESTKKDLLELFPFLSPSIITVIPLGVDHSQFNPMAASGQIKRKYELNSFILSVGNLEPRKNYCRLISAFSQIAAQIPHDLVIVGHQGWDYGPVYELLNRLKLGKRIRILDHVDNPELPALYNAADLFVYPSLYEGFGLPVLEAMACGCPVITSNVSSLPEVTGDAGLLIDPYSIDEIKCAILSMLQNEDLRKSYRKKGIDRARSFSWKTCAEKTIQVYRELGA